MPDAAFPMEARGIDRLCRRAVHRRHSVCGFPLLFPNGTDAPLTDYVAASEPGTLTDENDQYRLSVESVLFDESAGVGIVSLHLQNKSGDGVMPFAVIELLPEYQNQPDLVWSNLSECCAVQDGQYNFSVMYGESMVTSDLGKSP